MASVTILGRKCDLLLLAASVALVLFIVSVTMSDCRGCSGKCNKKSCGGGDGGEGSGECKKSSVPAPAGNIIGADDGTFSELADV